MGETNPANHEKEDDNLATPTPAPAAGRVALRLVEEEPPLPDLPAEGQRMLEEAYEGMDHSGGLG